MNLPSLDEVLNAIESFAPDALEAVVDTLCGCELPKLGVEALTKLGAEVARALAAKDELEAMRAAVKATDAAVQAAQQADLELKPTGGL